MTEDLRLIQAALEEDDEAFARRLGEEHTPRAREEARCAYCGADMITDRARRAHEERCRERGVA